MKILHLTQTQLAGAPLNLSNILNRYTPHESRVILKDFFRARSVRNLSWDYPLVRLSQAAIEEHIRWADVVLHHQRPWRTAVNKPEGIMFHAQPGNYRPGISLRQFQGRKLVIAQYHPRYYTDAEVVPNMIDIWAPEYQPAPKKTDRVVIFMGVASETPSGWGQKNSEGVRKVFNQIKSKHGERVEIRLLKGRPMEEVFAAKRDAELVVDECQTGSYHLSSLEGLAYGAVVFNNMDAQTHKAIERVTGVSDHPFILTDMNGLFERIDFFVNHPEKRREVQTRSREWIEQHWDPKVLVNQFVRNFEKWIAG